MKKPRKYLLLIYLVTLLIVLQTCPNIYASNNGIIPKVKISTAPHAVYRAGEVITVMVTCPNYSGKVQYRAIMQNTITKKQTEYYIKNKGYYSTDLINGTKVFTINWVVIVPGTYNITILAKRSGANAAYDSYVKTSTITIKPMECAVNYKSNLKIKYAGIILSKDKKHPVYFTPTSSNNYFINLSKEKSSTSITRVCIKTTNDCFLTFLDVNKLVHCLAANTEKLFTFKEINPLFLSKEISIRTLRAFAKNGYITVNVKLVDISGYPQDIKLSMKVK